MRRALAGLTAAIGFALIAAPAAYRADAQAITVPQQAPAAAETPIPPPASADQCGAAELAGLVGKPRADIPVPVEPSRRRVYCTTCMVTQDYDPTRLNIVFDAKTGLVTTIRCG